MGNGDDLGDYLAGGGNLDEVFGSAVHAVPLAERGAPAVARARAMVAEVVLLLSAPQVDAEERAKAAKRITAAVPDLAWLAVLHPAEYSQALAGVQAAGRLTEVVKAVKRAVKDAAEPLAGEKRAEERRAAARAREVVAAPRLGADPEPAVLAAIERKVRVVDGEAVPGTALPSLSNLEIIFARDSRWKAARYNLFTSLVEVGETAQDETSDVEAAIWCHRTYDLEAPVEKVVQALRYVAMKQHAYDPLTDYLDGLTWDGTPRVRGVLRDYFAAARPYGDVERDGIDRDELLELISARFLVSAVARAYEPGCKVDEMIVLVGVQGKGKSRTLRALCPRGEWFSDTHVDMRDKDRFQLLDGVWLYEMGEMDHLRGVEMSRVKGYVSSQADRYRKPYARAATRNLRRTVFLGSVNEREFVDDTTGLRRFEPVACEADRMMDSEGMEAVRDQVWAEAVVMYRAGFPWRMPDAAKAAMAEHADAFRIISPWEDPIRAFLFGSETRATFAEGFGVNDVLHSLGVPVEKRQQMSLIRTATGIMAMLGCTKRKVRSGGTTRWAWSFPPR